MLPCLRTLTERGRRCPLSRIGAPDCVHSVQLEPLGTAEAAGGVVRPCPGGRGAVHAAVGGALRGPARDGWRESVRSAAGHGRFFSEEPPRDAASSSPCCQGVQSLHPPFPKGNCPEHLPGLLAWPLPCPSGLSQDLTSLKNLSAHQGVGASPTAPGPAVHAGL